MAASGLDQRLGWFKWDDSETTAGHRALLLFVTVQPGASKSEFVGLHGALLKIRVQAPPVDGKANRALIEFIASAFDTPRSRIAVVRGDTSRQKTLRIVAPSLCPPNLVALGLQFNV